MVSRATRLSHVPARQPPVVTLRAGQGLFLPANWWHSTLNLTDSISYSISYSIRIVNHSNLLQTLAADAAGPFRALLKYLEH